MLALNVVLVAERPEIREQVQRCLQGSPVRMSGEELEVIALIDQIDRLRPDVVLVDTAVTTMPLQEVVAQIRMGCGSAMIIALHDSADSAAILNAFRAGVNEFLYPPFDQPLQAALQHKYDQQRGNNPGVRLKGKTIGFLSAKGGCGATTIAAHVSAELGRRGNQLVLLADLDLQNGIIRFLMNSKSAYSILDAMNNLHRLDQSYWKGLVSNGMPGLEIVSGPEAMSFKRPEPDQVRPVLKFARSNYEWTIVDLGRGLDPFILSALEEMDEAYIVLSLDVPALHQTKQLIKVLVDSGYRRNRIRLICNRIPKQIEMSPEDLEKMLGIPVYAMLPEDYQAVYDAYSAGRLVQPASNLGRHLNRLAMKLAGGTPEDKPKRSFFSFFK